MPITLTERTLRAAQIAQVKVTLEQYNYSVKDAALALGIHATKLSHMLNDSPAFRGWWVKTKAQRKKANRRARAQRWRDRRASGLVGY